MQKKFLAIDYGLKKIGLAIASADEQKPTHALAEPYKVLHYKSLHEVVEKIARIIESEGIKQVVLGLSEGKMAERTVEFGELLGEKIDVPVSTQDESLSTKEAQRLSIEAGIKRKKRKDMEDAYSATLILQAYLDRLRIDF